MSAANKRILVVLGMHRSGTSALTRGLQALGVSLGENLMPAYEGNNSKGFWEDLQIVALNDALLAELGLSWHSLGTLQQSPDWQRLLSSPLAAQAQAYLEEQTARYALFGLKDPRMARVLPFWLEIFKRCALEPIFLISSRDPLSVARSLEKRDGFLLGKSYYLWLEHVLPSLTHTFGYKRLVVSFDRLLEQPAQELLRIARQAHLPPPCETELAHYQEGFLEEGLRHFQHGRDELETAPELNHEALRVYQLLESLAQDGLPMDSPEIGALASASLERLDALGPIYRLVSAQDTCLNNTQEQLQRLQQDAETRQHEAQARQHEAQARQRESDEQLGALRHELDAQQQRCQTLAASNRDLHEAIRAMQASSSWRVTAPLRKTRQLLGHAHLQLRARGRHLAKRIYHALPARLRAPCLQLAYRCLGPLFRGMGHYETWHLARQSAHDELTSFTYQRASLNDAGQYELLHVAQPDYCYLPPRRTGTVDAALAGLPRKPLISIITPVYGVEPRFLEALIASVERQWYPHWELLLVEDAGPNPATRDYLQKLDAPQIRVTLCERNGGISAASNIALGMARGEYVAFLDHDDELTPDALFELVQAINNSDPDFIYSDEDKIDDVGNYSQPFFKPDWSPDALMSIMYTCHLACVRKSLADELGGFRSRFDGAQDYDFVLRLSELTQRIHHIPKVLYHWRTLPSSTASGLDAKPYASNAMRLLKEEALARRGLPGSVEPVTEMPSQYRVNYHPQGAPLVSIIIPSRDNAAILQRCVESLLRHTRYDHYEIVLIDNESVEPGALEYFQAAQQAPKIKVLRYPQPFNFSAINNFGVREARGDYLLFLNDDTEVLHPDWLERMLGFAQLPHVGAVGAKLLFPREGTIQHCGVLNLSAGPGHAFYNAPATAPLYFGRNILEWNWLAVTGACLLVERRKFDAVGGFDETFPVAYNDVDLCWRLHDQGLKSVVCNATQLLHHESVSRGQDDLDPLKRERLERERRRLYRKHPDHFAADPYFNPNLHGSSVNFLPQNF